MKGEAWKTKNIPGAARPGPEKNTVTAMKATMTTTEEDTTTITTITAPTDMIEMSHCRDELFLESLAQLVW